MDNEYAYHSIYVYLVVFLALIHLGGDFAKPFYIRLTIYLIDSRQLIIFLIRYRLKPYVISFIAGD